MEGLVGREVLAAGAGGEAVGHPQVLRHRGHQAEVDPAGGRRARIRHPGRIRRAGIAAIDGRRYPLHSNYGTLELREAIADSGPPYGVRYDPRTEIMVTVGVSEGVDAAMRALLDPGDEVLIPDPGYVAYEADVVFAGGASCRCPRMSRTSSR